MDHVTVVLVHGLEDLAPGRRRDQQGLLRTPVVEYAEPVAVGPHEALEQLDVELVDEPAEPAELGRVVAEGLHRSRPCWI